MSHRPSAVLVAVVGLTLGAQPAAGQYLGGGERTPPEVQIADLSEMRGKFLGLARAFPPEARDWRPMTGVRSVRDVVALIAAETVLFPTLWGYEVPEWIPEPAIGAELSRLGQLTFDGLLSDLDRGFGHLLELVEGMDETDRARQVDFFGLQVPMEVAVTLTANDMHEHLGQLIAYARTHQVVPPWSRSAERGAGPRPGDLLVANLQTNEVAWFEGASGQYRGAFVEAGSGGLQGATGVSFGPDGGLYVGSSQNHRILQYDGTTGEFAGVFVDGGELQSPFSIVFGPDGDLYVSSGTGHRVLRYDGTTGEFRGVAAEGGGLRQPIGLAFGPRDGVLYVVNSAGRNILRFDPATGSPLGVFASDSLRFPSDLAFGPDGDLYVTSAASSSVVRFDGRTGAFVETRLRLPGEGGVPVGLTFLEDGSMVVGDFGRNRLYLAPGQGGELQLVSEEGLGRPENIVVKPGG